MIDKQSVFAEIAYKRGFREFFIINSCLFYRICTIFAQHKQKA